ncbi:MAG: hypothetical protein K6E51_02805 [Treponema sp.]|nr:hypothetical protein [Treponema sp.]
MSFPIFEECYQLTDFYVKSRAVVIETDIQIYEGKYEDKNYLVLGEEGLPLCTISIPPFCEGQAKLGVFLKEFSILLNEMLVKWDKDVVQRLYTETMQKLFPDEVANYELGFYELRGFLYCTIQFSEEGHKKVFGEGWRGTSTARELSFVFRPIERLKFQSTDPAMEKFYEEQEKVRALRRAHPRRKNTLADFLRGDEKKD